MQLDKITMLAKILAGLLLIAVATLADEDEIATANANFATSLNKILFKEPENVFFSPLSLHSILTLVYQGAAGETADAFGKTLFLPSAYGAAIGYKELTESLTSVVNVTLDIANKVYVETGYKLRKKFDEIAEEDFHSDVGQVNFEENIEAAKIINDWVEEKTHNRIHDMIDPDSLNDMTRLVLLNAIYFKGNWATQFDEESTAKEAFYLNADDKVDVNMMHVESDFLYAHNSELDADIIELPYANKDISLVVILPNERDGIEKTEEKLFTLDMSSWSMRLQKTKIVLSLPRFKIESKINFDNALEKLGLGVIFHDDADFSGLLETMEPLHVSDIFQNAYIEVNEEGAEAAAVSGGEVTTTSVAVYLNVDHPFVFLIKYKDTVLFYGRINKPQ